MPLAALLAGISYEALGAEATLTVSGVVAVVAVVLMVGQRTLRAIPRLTELQEEVG